MEEQPEKILDYAELLLDAYKLEEARLLVVNFLKRNPNSARGWWLLSQALQDDRQRLDCLERVLRLEPGNAEARADAERLRGSAYPPPVTPVSEQESAPPPPAPTARSSASQLLKSAPAPEVKPVPPQESIPGSAASHAGPAVPTVAPFVLTPEAAEPESTPFDLFAPGAFDELKSKPPAAAMPAAMPAGSSAAGVGPAAPQPKDEVPAWALPPVPPQAAGTGKQPAGSKKRTWIVDAVIIGIVLCLILSVVAYFLISDLGKAMVSGIQATKETSQLLTSLPPATLEPTWTASPTFTLIPTDTFTPTLSPTAEPTGSEIAGGTPISPGAIGITAGMYPPDFSLQEVASQQTVTLHDYLGQPILIFFWATWCPYCNDEISSLQAVYEQYQEDGLVLLAVDMGETFAEVDAFRNTHDLTFPILLDEDFEASTLYKADSIPHHVFVGLSGRIMFVQTGELSATELANKVEATMRTYPTPTP